MGSGIGMFNCLYTILQQLLCPYGYENWFSGLCAACMITGGVVGATISGKKTNGTAENVRGTIALLLGIVVDRTRRYSETMKISMGFAVVFGLTFLQLTQISNISALILISCLLFGVMGLAMYPVGLGMTRTLLYCTDQLRHFRNGLRMHVVRGSGS